MTRDWMVRPFAIAVTFDEVESLHGGEGGGREQGRASRRNFGGLQKNSDEEVERIARGIRDGRL